MRGRATLSPKLNQVTIATAAPSRTTHDTVAPPAPRAYQWGKADWISTSVVGVLALITRFVGLTAPVSKGTPVFDEKHYVPQAWDMVRSWDNLFIGGIETNPGYGLVPVSYTHL